MTAPPGHDFDAVRHDGHAVQRGLPVEQHDIAIAQVPLYNVPHLHRRRPEHRQHAEQAAPWLRRAAHASRAGPCGQAKQVAMELACCRSARATLPRAAAVDVAASVKRGVPTLSSDATFRLSAYLRKERVPCWNSTMLAPGHAPPPANQALPSLATSCSLRRTSQPFCRDNLAALPSINLYKWRRKARKGFLRMDTSNSNLYLKVLFKKGCRDATCALSLQYHWSSQIVPECNMKSHHPVSTSACRQVNSEGSWQGGYH